MEEVNKTEAEAVTEEGGRKLPSVRTLKSDTADYVSRKGLSLAEITAEEAEKEGLKYGGIEEEKPFFNATNIIIMAVSAVLIIGAGVGAWLYFGREAETPIEPPIVRKLTKPFLLADDTVDVLIDISDEDKLSQSLLATKNSIKKSYPSNRLLNISLIERVGYTEISAPAKDFLAVIGANPPLEFLDGVEKDFLFMRYPSSKNWTVLVFKVKDYNAVFPSMVKWEREMGDSLKNIMETAGTQGELFTDKEVKNHDTRILLAKDGSPALAYSFINRKYLVITGGEEPLKEIFRRFSSPQYLSE